MFRVVLASVSARTGAARAAKSKLPATDILVDEFLGRLARAPGRWLEASAQVFATEAAILDSAARNKSRAILLVLLDSRGRQLSSEDFAAWLGARRDSGTQEIWLAVGPADGWSAAARKQAAMQLSLGPLTLPHELARVIAAEQLYRAWAILERHPYHCGH